MLTNSEFQISYKSRTSVKPLIEKEKWENVSTCQWIDLSSDWWKKKNEKKRKISQWEFSLYKENKYKIVNYMCNLLHAFVATGSDVNGRKSDSSFFSFFFFLHFNLKAGSIHHRSSSFSLPKLFEPVTNGHRIGYQRSLSINANQLGNGSRTLESLQSDTECSCFVRTIVTLLVRFELLVQPH